VRTEDLPEFLRTIIYNVYSLVRIFCLERLLFLEIIFSTSTVDSFTDFNLHIKRLLKHFIVPNLALNSDDYLGFRNTVVELAII
jgi:hypothetical protein